MTDQSVIVRNVAVTYGRMMLTVFASIWTTRLLFESLGTVDYGIFLVLGSAIGLLRTLSEAFASGTTRFLAFELGRDSTDAMRRVFTTSLISFATIGVACVSVGLALKSSVCNSLNIPPDRVVQSHLVYTAAVLSFSSMLIASPYMAAYRARQALAQDAWFSVASTFATLTAALSLSFFTSSRLAVWAAMSAGIAIGFNLLQVAVGTYRFPECRPALNLLRRDFTIVFLQFSGWAILGRLAANLRGGGSQILLNVFFGPVANTAFGIGSSPSGYLRTVTSVINRAVAPAMTTRLSREGKDRIVQMLLSAEKITLSLGLLMAVPMLFNGQVLLGAWVGQPPENSVGFMLCLLIAGLAELSSLSHVSGVLAAGEIGRLTRITTFLTLIPLPFSASVFALGGSPLVLGGVTVVVSLLLALAQVVLASAILGTTVGCWIRSVVAPALAMATCMALPHLALLLIAKPSIALIGLTTVVGAASGVVWLLLFGLNFQERRAAHNAFKRATRFRTLLRQRGG